VDCIESFRQEVSRLCRDHFTNVLKRPDLF